ncbi:MAG: hypothetical protein Unbinned6747contig1000_37 [Prokaryotic dsDNA virus sp.]|nr:MAG: hypothetical protein Unbinned6747contig1000_37 [Prokaryotic dsDNA virus sp.]
MTKLEKKMYKRVGDAMSDGIDAGFSMFLDQDLSSQEKGVLGSLAKKNLVYSVAWGEHSVNSNASKVWYVTTDSYDEYNKLLEGGK